ncbi:ATP-binding protein [Sulfurimonas sp.]|jgi:DNA replication protein DnaC|uniref:ATP-binding protein n=1 Tax=Sulfurimonas sp. TaxID=2022749 RepID=UPI0025D80425|nr:ATP-binding protein [Sulfurimonas sp.]MCK9455653.1 ATP-binding protein [Sulfurimonas sp.]
MAKNSHDIEQMLEELDLGEMSSRLDELIRSPEGMDLTPLQLLREVVSVQHLKYSNEQFKRNLKLSRLVRQDALLENLKSGPHRVYNDNLVSQLRTLEFIADRKNVTVIGESNVGKTYFLRAFCVEACRHNYRTRFIDYIELMDELLIKRRKDLSAYNRRLKYYSRIQVLIIDDFAIERYDSEATIILYSLIKNREIQGRTTMVSTQYSPADWNVSLSGDSNTGAQADGIRSRLIENGYLVFIEKAK